MRGKESMNKLETLSGERGADSVQRPCSASYPLFKHMLDTYNLTLIEDELQDIIAKADEARMKSNGRSGMVRWALVCALYHLDTEQLHELGEAIANRSGGTYSPNDGGEPPRE